MPTKVHNKKTRRLLIPITVSMHARLKVRAQEENRSMSSIVREVLDDYLGVPVRESHDVYDELSEKFSELLES